MRQKVEEGHLHQVAEVLAGAVKAAILHVGDLGTRRVGQGAQSAKASAAALNETKAGIDRVRTEDRDQKDVRKEEPKSEDNRVAAARVLALRMGLWVGRNAVFANGVAREGQADGHIGAEEAAPSVACLMGRIQVGACPEGARDRCQKLSFPSSPAHDPARARASPARDPFQTSVFRISPFQTYPARLASAGPHT